MGHIACQGIFLLCNIYVTVQLMNRRVIPGLTFKDGWFYIIYAVLYAGLVFMGLKATGFLRISKEAEEVGLDMFEFSPKSIPSRRASEGTPKPAIQEVTM